MTVGRSAMGASAGLGGILWLGLVAVAILGGAPLGRLELLFLVAPLVAAPLGFRLGDSADPLFRIACALQPLGAILAIASFWSAPGPVAATLACGWLFVAGLAGLSGASGLLRGGWRLDSETCARAGLVYLPIGAGWLVLSRLGAAPLGFGEPIVLLTAVHFHFAGFAAAIFASASLRAARRVERLHGAMELVIVTGVVAGPGLVAAGFLTSAAVSLGATIFLAACLCLLAVLTWICLPRLDAGPFRELLLISSISIVASMLLAVVYAWGEYTKEPVLDISRMVRLHGALNAVGFAVCGLLAWNLITIGRGRDGRSPAA